MALVAHREAHAKSVTVRGHRARLRRQLRSFELSFRDVDLTHPHLRTMYVFQLVAILPWHRVATSASASPNYPKAFKAMKAAGIPLDRTFGRLTDRQRGVLVSHVERLNPTQRRSA